MATLTADLEKRLKRLPQDLHGEFPDVPADTIERTVDAGARELLAQARFHDLRACSRSQGGARAAPRAQLTSYSP